MINRPFDEMVEYAKQELERLGDPHRVISEMKRIYSNWYMVLIAVSRAMKYGR
jgi:hypothetical protein